MVLSRVALMTVVAALVGVGGCTSTGDPATPRASYDPEAVRKIVTGEQPDCSTPTRAPVGRCKTLPQAPLSEEAPLIILVHSEADAKQVQQLIEQNRQSWSIPKGETFETWIIGEIVAVPEQKSKAATNGSLADTASGVGADWRPAALGRSVGPHEGFGARGTIGARVRQIKPPHNRYLLSNAHVLKPRQLCDGHPILEPAEEYWGSCQDGDTVARLGPAYVPAKNQFNLMDAALATTSLDCLGAATPGPNGYKITSNLTKQAEPGLEVEQYGAVSGARHGRIRCVEADLCVGYGQEHWPFYNQILIDRIDASHPPVCAEGDSGALVVTRESCEKDGAPCRLAVGLFFARAKKRTVGPKGTTTVLNGCVATPIDTVLEHFKVQIDDDPPPANPKCDLKVDCDDPCE